MAGAPGSEGNDGERREASGFGVTALLDELLLEANGGNGGEAQTEAVPDTEEPPCALLTVPEDHEAAVELARQAQELSDLSAEVDACLASLEDWREEQAQQKEALRKELEEHFGDVPDADATSEGEEDAVSEDVTEAPSAAPPREGAGGGAGLWAVKGCRVSEPGPGGSSLCELEELRRADEARIARLREEVEELKQQGVEMEARSRLAEAEALEAGAEGTGAGTGLSGGLRDWCAEVDAALGLPPQQDLVDTSGLDEDIIAGERRLLAQEFESQLVDVWAEGERLECALGAARGRVDLELGELERLLAECDDLQAKAACGHLALGGVPGSAGALAASA